MKKKIIYGVLSLIVVIFAIGLSEYLMNAKPTPQHDSQTHNIIYVKADQVKVEKIQAEMSYRGRVTAFDNVSLSAEVAGKILQGDVRFKAGESFTKGDVIIHIYSEDVEAALKSGKSGFMQTLSKILPDLRVDYSHEYDKWTTFFNALDVEKPLPALPDISSDKEKVFLAANNVLSGYYTLQQQEINLKRYTIYAPFDGSFKTVNKEIGAVASPGVELASIIRTDKMEVTVPVFPTDLKWIHKGDKVKIVNQNGEIKRTTVSRISTFLDETQSVNVYLTYFGSNLLEGEYVDVQFLGEIIVGFKVPREAVYDANSVYVLKDGKLNMLKVRVLRQLYDYYIISGVDENLLVVTESLASVNPEVEYQSR